MISQILAMCLLAGLIEGVSIKGGSCTYKGQSFPHAPATPVKGDTHVCICQDGVWIQCKSNAGEIDLFGSAALIKKDKNQETALEARQDFSNGDFVFNLRGQQSDSSGLGGSIRVASLAQFPALAGQGVSYTLFQLDPCGINLPHVHPRATEIIFVLKGSKLRTAFVEENSGRTLVNDISEGKITFFPEGLIHYQQNLGCDPVEFISALNSEDPGVVTISTRIFTLPSEALQATFNLNQAQVELIKKGIPAGPAKGRIECLKRCGLWEK